MNRTDPRPMPPVCQTCVGPYLSSPFHIPVLNIPQLPSNTQCFKTRLERRTQRVSREESVTVLPLRETRWAYAWSPVSPKWHNVAPGLPWSPDYPWGCLSSWSALSLGCTHWEVRTRLHHLSHPESTTTYAALRLSPASNSRVPRRHRTAETKGKHLRGSVWSG